MSKPIKRKEEMAENIEEQIYKHLDSLPYAGGYPSDYKETLAKHLAEYLSSPPDEEQEGQQNKHWKEVTEIILKDYAAVKHQQYEKPTSPDELKQKFKLYKSQP